MRKMQLIIDSGATNTTCILLQDGDILVRFVSAGINISYTEDDTVSKILESCKKTLKAYSQKEIEEIYFYGAGCGKRKNADRLSGLLSGIFPHAVVYVYSDLLAACHALCGEKPGWVAILGTGSSCCLYDGETILHTAPSLGYFLGDEGSGTHLGKLFIISYLSGQLPKDMSNKFEAAYQTDHVDIMERIYREAYPNKFLASLPPFLLQNSGNASIGSLCRESFTLFFRQQILHFREQYHNGELLNLMGSIAFHFKDIISEAAKENGVRIGRIMADPIEELAFYYRHIPYSKKN